MTAIAIFNAHLFKATPIKGGLSLTLIEETSEQRVYHRMAAFGPQADQLTGQLQPGAMLRLKTLIRYSQKGDTYYTNFNVIDVETSRDEAPSAKATLHGHICSFQPFYDGYTITLFEFNQLQQQRFYHRITVRGKVAQAIRPKLERDSRLEVSCEIRYARKDGRFFTNFEVKTWRLIPKQKQAPKTPRPTRSDDYYVPEVGSYTRTAYERRYEGFTG